MASLLQEFKEFAVKGNMVDMAVGIIIGTAFNRVVDALVKQIVMPPLSILTGGINYTDKKLVLKEGIAAVDGGEAVEEVAIGYGILVQSLVDFLIIGLTIFVVVKFLNRFKKKAEDPKDKTVVTPKDIELLSNLNDLMEEQNKLLRERGN
ncbi:large-conductance mechanosensitive channel protein MscL [Zunongwangia sp. F260]|uniref:Large-conductance mechanosensitive channel n=2 Tax=Autumnicola TaxID=3160927 RepID=A0ABU3CJP8_9FLAO|nr:MULTISPECIES: large-conductance mechanosensitive channel protein MscL [unclassified Zunongwangia]MDT0646582.1 large-conductance mechanosensitive channel protein MscL [Zunongwangia sp. F260]MDT0685847.1 large-conductance mechanosensitive channel protein MscL [Zunongwangia sp. F225]